jgi:hypothetical protein
VHLESDVIGKFVQHLLTPYLKALPDSGAAPSPQVLGTALGLFRSMGT